MENRDDLSQMENLLKQLWPSLTNQEARDELDHYINGENTNVFTRTIDGNCVGIALCSLRNDYVEGCESSPVGYLEGISIDKKYRMKGIAASLVLKCEEWAKSKGCKEFASDCELSNADSFLFHRNIGFEEINRIICFKKDL